MSSKQTDRRRFLKSGAALAGLAASGSVIDPLVRPMSAQSPAAQLPERRPPERRPDEWYDYGVRSRFVTSARIGTNGRYGRDPRPGVPRDYGFRTPHQDGFGIITPPSLHFIINHAYDPPDIDPRAHRLMIHGLVDRPLVFTMDELMRLPSVSRIHFLECAGNSTASGQGFVPGYVRTQPEATVQQTHGFTSCSEWTGVQLSLLLQEAGLQREGKW